MNKIFKINFAGFALSAAAMAASGALVIGCGPAPAVRPAPVTTGGSVPPLNPTLIAQDIQNISDITSFPAQTQAQINALIGTYQGSLDAWDSNDNRVVQTYTVVLSKATNTTAPGKTFVQAAFSAGPMSFAATMQINYQAASYGSAGATIEFTSIRQNVPALDPYADVILDLRLRLDSSGNLMTTTTYQFDPTQSAGSNGDDSLPIRIVDGVSLKNVVDFYDDFHRH